MAIRTIILKLHRPSRRKRQIMDQAILDYSRAYQYLLDRAQGEIDHIQREYKDNRGGFRAVGIVRWIDKDLSRELNKFGVEPFKDSLKIDFSMTLASYLSLKQVQEDVSFPIAYLSGKKWEETYERSTDQLLSGKRRLSEYEREIDKLDRKSTTMKPLFFCRYDTNRDYCLLYDQKNNRYYAKLYLMNVKSNNKEVISVNEDKELKYIHKDGQLLENSGKKERFILIPLTFGRWQEQYLKKALDNPGMLKTARLIKKQEEYFLSVNIDIGETEKIETDTYMGVARGLKSPVHFTVIDSSGNVKGSGAALAGLLKDSKNTISDNSMYKIANMITDIAVRNKSQVVVQSLIDRGDKLQWENGQNQKLMPILNCYNYNRLLKILEYKLDEKGLPAPVKVSPVSIFYTCPHCGLHARQNRFSKDMFICIACGMTMDIEQLGSLNLARRLMDYGKGILKVKVERTSQGVKFINKALGLEFCPSNPHDCMDEFIEEIQRIIKEFHKSSSKMVKDREFKRMYSLIRKIEEEKDFSKLIQII